MHPWQTKVIQDHCQRLVYSYHHWTGTHLIAPDASPTEVAEHLFQAPFALLSHGTEPDPILNYGNQTALKLWDMTWEDFTQMPSRLTAEEREQGDRTALLSQVLTSGYIENIEGVRIAKTGRKFWVGHLLLWEVVDAEEQRWGQAATFPVWKWV
jgi:hypothetical protein